MVGGLRLETARLGRMVAWSVGERPCRAKEWFWLVYGWRGSVALGYG